MEHYGICERFQKTVLNEFYRVTFRKNFYHSLEELQADLDAWLVEGPEPGDRPHIPDELAACPRNVALSVTSQLQPLSS